LKKGRFTLFASKEAKGDGPSTNYAKVRHGRGGPLGRKKVGSFTMAFLRDPIMLPKKKYARVMNRGVLILLGVVSVGGSGIQNGR